MQLDTNKIDLNHTTFIWSRSALEIATKLGVNMSALQVSLQDASHSNVVVYPDGSLQFEGLDALETFENCAGDKLRDHSIKCSHSLSLRRSSALPLGGAWYSGLQPFADARKYALSLWGDFTSKNDGSHLLVRPGFNNQFGGNPQCPIDDLRITFVFHRKLTKETRTLFTELILTWLDDSQRFGIGPVVPKPNELTFYNRVGFFRVDAQCSDQHAINWLILSLIDFCKRNVVLKVCFTEKSDAYTSFDDEYGLAGEIPTLVPL